MLLRDSETQEAFEAEAPHDVAASLDVGVRVTVHRDGANRIVGWDVHGEDLPLREDLW